MVNDEARVQLRDSSWDEFRSGTLGNAGQNLYVSRAGGVQRITQTSLFGSGYVDIPFANSHDDAVNVPAYLYTDPLGSLERAELETTGAFAGAVGDLTGDGFDDIVIANQYDGATNEVHAQIYFGSAEGYNRKRMVQLWAPSSKDVAIGTFDAGAKPSIALVSRERLRVFSQGPSGFATALFADIDLGHGIDSLVVADLDGDGIDDLIVRAPDSSIHVYWGGDGGITPARKTVLDRALTGDRMLDASADTAAMGGGDGDDDGIAPTGLFVYAVPEEPRLKTVDLDGRPHIFLCPEAVATFVAFDEKREALPVRTFASGAVLSAAVGDVRGTGAVDVVFAARQVDESGDQHSLIYWGGEGDPERFTTHGANDVAAVDLDGDGCAEVIVCQDKTDWMYSTESLIYRGGSDGLAPEPIRLPTHCALDVLFPVSPTDGRPKPLFVNHLSNTVRGNVDSFVYLGGPDGYAEDRRVEFRGWAATQLKFVDFRDNGRRDVLVTNSNENWLEVENGSFLYVAGDDGSFSDGDRIELQTRHSMSTVVADLNRDGYLDIIACGWHNSQLQLFYGGPDGFGEPVPIELSIDGVVYDNPRFMTLADLNRNGYLDIVVPTLGENSGLVILWGGPDGYDGSRATVLDTGGVVSTKVADLDGDGWLDLIVGGFKGSNPKDDYRTSVYIYWGGPNGFSNDRRSELPANFAADVAVADLDNDGVLDLVVANYNGYHNRDIDSYVYWGSPSGEFHPHRMTRLFQHSACGLLLADFDEDGWIDIAVANHKTRGNHPGSSFVWSGGPEGFSEDRRIALPTAGPHGISHLDIGNQYDRGPEEYFTSRIFELDRDGSLERGEIDADLPAKTWVRLEVRSATTADEIDAAQWLQVPLEDGAGVGLDVQRFVQYRLALGAVNSVATPRVTAVALEVVLRA